MIEQFNKLPLSELFESVIGGGTPPRAIPEYWNGSIPWASVKDFSDNELKLNKTQESITKLGLLNSTSKLIKTGTPIICLRMAVGRVAIANKDVSINQDLKALFTKGNIDSLYLVYLLDFSRSEVMRRSIGSTVKGISTSELLRIQVPFPESLDTQQKIATILSTVDNLIEKTQSLIDKYTSVKQGMMADLFTRGIDLSGTPETNKNYGQLRPSVTESPELYQETELGWVPKDWAIVQLRNICHKITDGSHQSVKTTEDGDVPFLFVSSVRNGQILWDKTALITNDDYAILSKGREPKKGDVLYTAVGSYGHAAGVDEDVKFAFQRHIAYIKPDNLKIKSSFLTELLNFDMLKRWADKVALGNAQKTVTLGELSKYPVILPTLAEQKTMLGNLSSISNTIELEAETLLKQEKIKKGLMQDLLTGKVSVKSD